MNDSARTTQLVSSTAYRIGDLCIDVGRHTVRRGDEELPLPGLSFDLLLALVRAAPNMLTHDQLMDLVWAPAVVNIETLNQRVKLIRNALGDDSRNPRYILSVHGRGYRIIPDVIPLQFPDATVLPDATPSASSTGEIVPTNTHQPVRHLRWIMPAATFLLLAGVVTSFWHDRNDQQANVPPSMAVEATPTLAVLPFVNLSAQPDDEYLADGISEEILNRLASMPGLQVVARTSAFRFKGKSDDVKEIGRKLGVQYVLEGSVRREGERIRVFVQLANTQNGYRLWSETLDHKMESAFEIQERIAESVAGKLALNLVAIDARPPASHRLTDDAQALDLYLRARHLYQSWAPRRIDKAIELFNEAIRIDPQFAEAYVALAEAYFAKDLNTAGCCQPRPLLAKRGEMLRRALQLDPNNANAIAGIGLDLMYAWNFEEAEKYLRRAEALNPNGEFVLRSFTWFYTDAGWPPQNALVYAERFFKRDPLNPFAALVVCQAYLAIGDYENALAAADRMVELDPDYWPGQVFRSTALAYVGRYDEALAVAQRRLELKGADARAPGQLEVIDAYARMGNLEEAAKIYAATEPNGSEDAWDFTGRAYALALLHRWDESLDALERAFEMHSSGIPSTLTMDVFIPLHDNPRFRKMVAALKFERRIEYTRRVAETRRLALAGR